jgi:hypothetical protein
MAHEVKTASGTIPVPLASVDDNSQFIGAASATATAPSRGPFSIVWTYIAAKVAALYYSRSQTDTLLSAKLGNLVEDTSPQIGGNLDLNGFSITGLVIGTNVQAYDADLAAIAGLTSAADRLPYYTGAGAAALATFTAAGRALVDDADAAAQRTTLGLAIGTDVQAYDADLAAIAGLTSAADRLPYYTGAGAAGLATFTAAGRALVDDADAAAQRTTLGLAIGSNVQAYDADLAALAALTGTNTIYYRSGADTWTAVTIGSGLTFSGGTLSAGGGGGGISEIVQDTSPQLGGNLDLNGFQITGLVIGTNVQAYDADLAAIAGLTSAADRLPYYTGAGTAGLATFTAAGRALVDDADAAAQRTTLGLAIGTNVQAYDADLAAIAGLTSAADRLPYYTGAGTAGLATFTAAGRALVDDADAAAQRTTLGLAIGTDVQAYDADLAAIAGLTSAADRLPYYTGAGAAALATFTAAGRALVDDADAAAQRTTLGLAIGADVQAYDADLAAIAGLTSAADRLPYYTGAGAAGLATFTAAGRALVDDADAAAQRTTLGLAIGTNVQAYDADLAALAALTGTNTIYYRSGADTWTAVTIGSGLTFSGGTLSAGGGGGGITEIVQDTSPQLGGNLDLNGFQITGLVIGTNVQAYDADLAAIAGLTSAADRLPYYTGAGAAGLATFTAAGRALVDDVDAAAQRTTLGLGNVDNTSDADKPTSTAQLADILAYAGAATDRANHSGTQAISTVTGLQTALDGKQAGDADLTALAALTGTNTIYYRSGVDTWTAVTIGSGLTFSGGTLASTGGGGGSVATDTIWNAKGDLAVASGADAASRLAVGSNGKVPVADSGATVGIDWYNPFASAVALGDLVTGGSSYGTGAGGAASANFALTANLLYKYPFFVPRRLTITSADIQLAVAGAAGKKYRFGARQVVDDGDGTFSFAAAPLFDSGELAADAAAGKKTATGSWTFTPGWYVFEIVSDGAPSFRGSTAVAGSFGPGGVTLNSIHGVTRAYTYTAGSTALPTNEDTAVTPGTLTAIGNGTAVPFFTLNP